MVEDLETRYVSRTEVTVELLIMCGNQGWPVDIEREVLVEWRKKGVKLIDNIPSGFTIYATSGSPDLYETMNLIVEGYWLGYLMPALVSVRPVVEAWE